MDIGTNMKKLTLISLFAGCGGSSHGYKLSGNYDERLLVEWWKPAVNSLKMNYPSIPVLNIDISKVTGEELLKNAGISALDVLDGSPPCQGFSMTGKREMLDPRNDLVNHYIRLVHEVRPRVFVMENVKGMIQGIMKGLFNGYLESMKKNGYTVFAKLMNAQFYGIPQSRERVIIIGFKSKKDADRWKWPEPSKTIIPLKDVLPSAISTVNHPMLSDSYGKLYDYIKPGKSAASVLNTGFNNCVRLDRNRPASTIGKMQTLRGFATTCHPDQKRALTIEECKIICSFPPDYKLDGDYTAQWGQLGNSVPPLMMKAIADQLTKALI